MTESEKRQITDLWEGGVSLEQIYKTLPCKRYHAYKIVNQMREQGTLKPRSKNETVVTAIANVWKHETKDIQEIANIFGYSPATVDAYLRMSGVREGKRPSVNYRHCAKTNNIVSALKEGKSVAEITQGYGVSKQYVYQIKDKLKKNGELI